MSDYVHVTPKVCQTTYMSLLRYVRLLVTPKASKRQDLSRSMKGKIEAAREAREERHTSCSKPLYSPSVFSRIIAMLTSLCLHGQEYGDRAYIQFIHPQRYRGVTASNTHWP